MGKTPKRVWANKHQNFASKFYIKILMQKFEVFFERVWPALELKYTVTHPSTDQRQRSLTSLIA